VSMIIVGMMICSTVSVFGATVTTKDLKMECEWTVGNPAGGCDLYYDDTPYTTSWIEIAAEGDGDTVEIPLELKARYTKDIPGGKTGGYFDWEIEVYATYQTTISNVAFTGTDSTSYSDPFWYGYYTSAVMAKNNWDSQDITIELDPDLNARWNVKVKCKMYWAAQQGPDPQTGIQQQGLFTFHFVSECYTEVDWTDDDEYQVTQLWQGETFIPPIDIWWDDDEDIEFDFMMDTKMSFNPSPQQGMTDDYCYKWSIWVQTDESSTISYTGADSVSNGVAYYTTPTMDSSGESDVKVIIISVDNAQAGNPADTLVINWLCQQLRIDDQDNKVQYGSTGGNYQFLEA